MRKTHVLLATIVCLIGSNLIAQVDPFEIRIVPIEIPNLGGLQSFAHGQYNGKWIIIGGRLDGLHRRQPFAAFDVAGNNNQLIVIDPISKEKWSTSVSSLPISLQDQLSSTNMEFHQDGAYLYLIGGYGHSVVTGTKKTFENLTVIHVPSLIDAIIAGNPITSFFRQITDQKFAVTGGHLKKINSTFYLMGGNRFDGNYNPNGNPSYTQVYTDAIRKFTLVDDGNTLTVTHLPETIDAANLHRRDYNAVSQIFPTGNEGVTMFSGVFQQNVNLPFLNCINVDSVSHTPNSSFQQYYNHYHCPVLPIYSLVNNQMHTVFFGGIAQYYDSLGILVQDNNVPFVKTIARVTRTADGNMLEYKLPIEMPSLLGAGGEFIPAQNIPHYSNEVMKLDELTLDTTLIGHIYGGISSTAANVFFTNTGSESSASSQLFQVYLIKNKSLSNDELNVQSAGKLKLNVYPNPNNGQFMITFTLQQKVPVELTITDINGKIIEKTSLENNQVGENTFTKKNKHLMDGGIYFITLETPTAKISQKIIVNP